MKNRRAIHRADCKRSEWAWWRWGRARSSVPDCRSNVSPTGATWTGCTFCNGLSLMDAAVNPGTGADHSSGPGGLRRRCTNCRINSRIPTRSRYGTRAPMTLPPKTSQEGGKDGREAVYGRTDHQQIKRCRSASGPGTEGGPGTRGPTPQVAGTGSYLLEWTSNGPGSNLEGGATRGSRSVCLTLRRRDEQR